MVSSLTGHYPPWMGSKQPTKRIVVVQMRKREEMEEIGNKFKIEGGGQSSNLPHRHCCQGVNDTSCYPTDA